MSDFNQMKEINQAITSGRTEKNPVVTCEGTVIPVQDELELLGFDPR